METINPLGVAPSLTTHHGAGRVTTLRDSHHDLLSLIQWATRGESGCIWSCGFLQSSRSVLNSPRLPAEKCFTSGWVRHPAAVLSARIISAHSDILRSSKRNCFISDQHFMLWEFLNTLVFIAGEREREIEREEFLFLLLCLHRDFTASNIFFVNQQGKRYIDIISHFISDRVMVL